MTNFDFLQTEPTFECFAEAAICAEKVITVDPNACAINCRIAMERAIKWLYSIEKDLAKPYQDDLYSLLSSEEFRKIISPELYKRLDYIRRLGNIAAHDNRKRVRREEAMLCLENLFVFVDFIAYCYSSNYTERKFDPSLISKSEASLALASQLPNVDLEALLKENEQLRQKLSEHSQKQRPHYQDVPLEKSEYETRKLYIDVMLTEAGWVENRNWLNEVPIDNMPTKSGQGRADYVLYGQDGKPLAIIEAKRSCSDPTQGRQQAKLYADSLEKKYGRRPVIFLTNGFDTKIIDGQYPERKVATFYSQSDLEKLFNLRSNRQSLVQAKVDPKIAGRYYQKAAIKAICSAFEQKSRRKALLVMATGSGKTRTIIALSDILTKYGWVKNILFLADRNALVTQAKRNFTNLLPNLTTTNLCEEKDYSARCICSTYQTINNLIDKAESQEGQKVFTCGHFDLIICDEAHRSIYNKYKDIIEYFDAPIVGLTATPKQDIDRNTYELFELEDGVPTYAYELEQAVKDGFLVNYKSIETKLKFMNEGIHYDELSEREQEEYEEKFKDENDDIPSYIGSSALNKTVFNRDTIVKVLDKLMQDGLKVDYGNKIGKTIIFAINHRHAEAISKIFAEQYPQFKDFAQIIDNQTKFSQKLIDDFSDPKKLPQIAISVDMLDTGIDIPEVLNLVFFKKVLSPCKFWQMIGRGTRLCPKLIDGQDKKHFRIFDWYNNFEYFRTNPHGQAVTAAPSLSAALFGLQFEIIHSLQDLKYQTENLINLRKQLVREMVAKVQQLNKNNFAVRQHLKIVERYSKEENYQTIEFKDIKSVKEELAPLITGDGTEDIKALRFDALLYGLELQALEGKVSRKRKKDLQDKAESLACFGNIPDILKRADTINKITQTDFLNQAGAADFEQVRVELRDLLKFLPNQEVETYETNFTDDVLSVEENEADLASDLLKNYKAKVEFYIQQHQNSGAISKLKNNIPLNQSDWQELEHTLWNELGSREDYEAEYGTEPLGKFIRGIVGLDMQAAKAAFSQYLDETNFSSEQIYFVNQIVEYIVQNGLLEDLKILQETPFTDRGSVGELFGDNRSAWTNIRSIIEQINANAKAA